MQIVCMLTFGSTKPSVVKSTVAMEGSGESSWRNDKIFILLAGSAVIIILLHPWIFFLSFLSFSLGYCLLDGISEKLKILFLKPSADGDKAQAFTLDPLLHTTPFLIGDNNGEEDGTVINNEKLQQQCRGSTPVTTCIVCDDDSCNRSEFSSSSDNTNSGGCHNKIEFGRASSRDLCVDPELDQAIARFCTSVFDYYISTSWAPYETRKQLKLAFKKVLTNFGQQLECSLVEEKGAVSFCEEKVIPLCIHYLEKISERRNSRRPSSRASDGRDYDLEKFANLKVRRLCRQLLESNLPSEYQQCKLWMELCLAVLADGVLWNLILLGRNRLPGLFVQLIAKFKRISDSVSPVPDVISIIYSKASSVSFRPQQVDNQVVSSQPVSRKVSKSQVPLLLGSFLDPVNDLYQPDMIFSRWRPTLDEILVERDLLYCLIQYLKGQQALEYLQAVLDESPDGNLYCRKVLQLEYLPGFCRSRYFMETLGISQVDCALEAGNDSPGTRRKLGHSRSSSYGGGNSGIQIWKIGDPKAVDGLPLHNTNQSVQSLGSSVEIDTTSYRRRQFSIEELIYKFLQSTTNPRVDVESVEKSKRVGIHGKSYEDYAADQVASKLVLGNCDIFECASQLAISWLDRRPWIQPVLSGWSQLLRPYMKTHLDTLIKSQLEQNLSLHNCVFLINLVTDAFLSLITDTPEEEEEEEAEAEKDKKDLNSKSKDVPEDKKTQLSSLSSLCCWFLNLLIDTDSFAQAVKDNEDEIILFFVDLLDLLVNQVVGGGREK